MKCKICNSNTDRFTDEELKKVFYHCKECQLIFLDSTFQVSENSEKNQYDQHNNSLENEGYVKMFNDFLDFSLKDLDIRTVLDFGSGPTPVLAKLLKKRSLHVEHYDKFYQPNKVYKGHLYDFITSTEVFEHLDNPKEVLKLLASHLNPNGIVSIMTLFHTNKKDEFLKWWYRRDPTHITFFTPKSIEIMAEDCGLKVLRCDNKRVITLQKIS